MVSNFLEYILPYFILKIWIWRQIVLVTIIIGQNKNKNKLIYFAVEDDLLEHFCEIEILICYQDLDSDDMVFLPIQQTLIKCKFQKFFECL